MTDYWIARYVYYTIRFTVGDSQIYIFKNPKLRGFFTVKPRHPDGLEKNRSGWKKTAMGALVVITNNSQLR